MAPAVSVLAVRDRIRTAIHGEELHLPDFRPRYFGGYQSLENCRKHRISTRLEASRGVKCVWSSKCGVAPLI